MQLDDLIQALHSEVEIAASDLDAAWVVISGPTSTQEARTEALESYTTQVMRMIETAGMLGLNGVQAVCQHVLDTLGSTPLNDASARDSLHSYITGWIPHALAYLSDMRNPDVAAILASHISGGPLPMAADQAESLLAALLAKPQDTFLDAEAPMRPTTAAPEDVSLALPPDCDPSLLDAFLQEAPEQATELGGLSQKLASRQAKGEDIAQAKRIAHTFKGSANIVGIKGITRVAHHMEDIFEFLEDHPSDIPAALGNDLIDAAGCLEQMVYALLGQEDPPTQALQVLQSMLDWANRIDKGDLFVEPVETGTPHPPPAAAPNAAEPQAQNESVQVAAAGTTPAPEGVSQSLRISVKTVDDLFRLVGELSLKIGQFQSKLRDSSQRARQLLSQNLIIQKRIFELENLVDIRGLAAIRARGAEESGNFDPLEMDQYNELHSQTRALIEEVSDARALGSSLDEDLSKFAGLLAEEDRIKRDLQYLALSTRMSPVKTLVPRLQRNVRQTCHDTGKEARLVVEGADTLIDGEILNRLADPLLHILRNAVDHGIEPAEERTFLGKPAEGTIKLSFERLGQGIIVRCSDDGRGLDYSAIRTRAIERGLIDEAKSASETELARMICLPGFSTRNQVSEISGRGVGLDVVRTRMLHMKGSVDIHSDGSGKGSVIEMRLPASLVALHALVVEAGGQMYTISSYSIETAIAPHTAEFVKTGSELQLRFRGSYYPVWTLAQLVGISTGSLDEETLKNMPAVLVRVENNVVAIMVDAVIDSRELIFKDMGPYLRSLKGVSGASVLGDGSVAPALDIGELLRTHSPGLVGENTVKHIEEVTEHEKRVLVVDDSLSMRRTLTQLVEDAGFAVKSARDGLEAITLAEKFHPDILLTDLEMPNMNGLELTAHLRGKPETASLPVIMITSRSQAKHKQQAELSGVDIYLTKPYSDSVLLGHIRTAMERHGHDIHATA